MLSTSIAFLVTAAAGMVLMFVVISWIERAKERHRPELERVTRERRQTPLIFLSYRRHDIDIAKAATLRMQQEGWTVVMYDPDRPWDDATQEIKQTIETASAVGYLEGASSNWIRAEIELSENGRVPLFRFQDLTQLEALLPAIREASQRINLVERLLSCHPHDREMIAVQLFARHVDGLDRGGRDAPFIKAMLPVMELVHDPRYYGQRILLVLFTVVFWLCLAIGVVLLIVYAAGLFLAKIF